MVTAGTNCLFFIGSQSRKPASKLQATFNFSHVAYAMLQQYSSLDHWIASLMTVCS